jgi:hypothetical protein
MSTFTQLSTVANPSSMLKKFRLKIVEKDKAQKSKKTLQWAHCRQPTKQIKTSNKITKTKFDNLQQQKNQLYYPLKNIGKI